MSASERKKQIAFMLREEASRAQAWAEGLRQIAKLLEIEAAQEGESEDGDQAATLRQ